MIEIINNKLIEKEIFDYLTANDHIFIPALSTRVNIRSYAHKLYDKAHHFGAYYDGRLIGFAACYFNHPHNQFAFLSSISIIEEFQGMGIATGILQFIIKYGENLGFEWIELEVYSENINALKFYNKLGFRNKSKEGKTVEMVLYLRNTNSI